MYSIKPLPEFTAWLEGLKDRVTRLRLARRLDKAQRGNPGDVKVLGNDVFEIREHFGPGWRMNYIQRDGTLIIMLGGGDKSTQSNDIAKAIKLSTLLEE
jgi:putative addiction module killer protein